MCACVFLSVRIEALGKHHMYVLGMTIGKHPLPCLNTVKHDPRDGIITRWLGEREDTTTSKDTRSSRSITETGGTSLIGKALYI